MAVRTKQIDSDFTPSNYTNTSTNVDGHLEGIDNALSGLGSGNDTIFDLGGYFPGTPSPDEVIISQVVTKDLTVIIDSPGTAGSVTAPTGDISYDITVDGGSVGSIDYTSGVSLGSISWTGSASVPAGSVLEIVAPSTVSLIHEGVSIVIKAVQSGGDDDYTIQGFFPGTVDDGETIFSIIAPREFAIDDNDNGSAAGGVVPSSAVTYDILVDGAMVGTIAFSGAASTGTVSWTGDRIIASGSVITVDAPTPADSTHADITITLNANEFDTTAYDLLSYFPSTPGNSEVILFHQFTRNVFLDGLDPGTSKSNTAATASTTYTILKNSAITIGTIVYDASGTDGAISITADELDLLFEIGDTISVSAPASPDSTHAEINISLKCEVMTNAIRLAALQSQIDDTDTTVTPVTADLDLTASVTSSDGDAAYSGSLTSDPNGRVLVFINGIQETVGDAVKTKVFYFSSDAGTTARAFSTIASGDTLHFNGSVAGFELDASDRLDLIYETI